MKILVLGGTQFVGRHLCEAALARGHDLTLFNRGRQGAGLFPEAEQLVGDRDGDGLNLLKGRAWDAVVDTCGYVPRVVRQSAELLAGSVGTYAFISTVSVYNDFGTVGLTENSPVRDVPAATVEEITGETYGPLKVACEQAVEAVCPGRGLIIRPGFIAGPFDPTGRFTYWVRRTAAGGTALAAGAPERRFQIIDARDLADWTVRLLEQNTVGTLNAVGPASPLTWGELLETCRTVSGADTHLTWADDAFLESQQAAFGALFPLYFPDTPAMCGIMAISNARALGAGLTFRPLAETVLDTLAWDNSLSPETRPQGSLASPTTGITAAREAELLARLRLV